MLYKRGRGNNNFNLENSFFACSRKFPLTVCFEWQKKKKRTPVNAFYRDAKGNPPCPVQHTCFP